MFHFRFRKLADQNGDNKLKIFKALNLSNENWPDNITEALDSIPENAAFEVPEVMFTKITDEQRETWKEQFSGN